MTDITNIEHARVFKRMGLPLNTEVREGGEFSKEYSEHWYRLMMLKDKFDEAWLKYWKEPTPELWRTVEARFLRLNRWAYRCEDFAVGLAGGDLDNPVFETELASVEHFVLMKFLAERVTPFIAFWNDVIETLNRGEPVQFTAKDIPEWVEK
jgi:hypothetical protein